jgi:hypothetical protein
MIRSCKLAEIYAAAASAASSAAAVAAEAASAAKLRIAERKEKDRIRKQLKRKNATVAEKEAWKAKDKNARNEARLKKTVHERAHLQDINTLARQKARKDVLDLIPEKAKDTKVKDTLARKQARADLLKLNPEKAEDTKVRNAQKHRKARLDPKIRNPEQARDLKARNTKNASLRTFGANERGLPRVDHGGAFAHQNDNIYQVSRQFPFRDCVCCKYTDRENKMKVQLGMDGDDLQAPDCSDDPRNYPD